MTMTQQLAAHPNPTALRVQFKQRCSTTAQVHQNWQVRIHRALSWYQRASEFGPEHSEARFLYLWIGLNSLYSRWDPEKNRPDADSHARRNFLGRIIKLDGSARIESSLRQHRPLIKKLLSNPFLSEVFWRNPDDPKAKGHGTSDANYLERNLRNKDFGVLLEQVMDRIFVLRSQLVHGASTSGSRLNRTSLRHCLTALQELLPIILEITIEHGCSDDWPELCYRPVS